MKGTRSAPTGPHPDARPALPLAQSAALKISALLGALAVGLGAFGAHALEDQLAETGRTGTWETAVLYHLVHAGILVVLATLPVWRPRTWMAFCAGIVIFSGSLYTLCLTGITWLGAVTPIGGVLLIAGWLALLRSPRS
jgi:uncharacterized membrane protein YgdD (TMEM256/DUF423 family)